MNFQSFSKYLDWQRLHPIILVNEIFVMCLILLKVILTYVLEEDRSHYKEFLKSQYQS